MAKTFKMFRKDDMSIVLDEQEIEIKGNPEERFAALLGIRAQVEKHMADLRNRMEEEAMNLYNQSGSKTVRIPTTRGIITVSMKSQDNLTKETAMFLRGHHPETVRESVSYKLAMREAKKVLSMKTDQKVIRLLKDLLEGFRFSFKLEEEA